MAKSSTPISCDFQGVDTTRTFLTGDSANCVIEGVVDSSPIATTAAANFRRPKIVSALTSYAARTFVESPRRKRATCASSRRNARVYTGAYCSRGGNWLISNTESVINARLSGGGCVRKK